jgi:hypothetical protein
MYSPPIYNLLVKFYLSQLALYAPVCKVEISIVVYDIIFALDRISFLEVFHSAS